MKRQRKIRFEASQGLKEPSLREKEKKILGG